MSKFAEQIQNAVNGRNPLVFLQTPEENRVEETLRAIAPDCYENAQVSTWSCTSGILPSPGNSNTKDPVTAIQTITKKPHPGFYVMKDMPGFMDQHDVEYLTQTDISHVAFPMRHPRVQALRKGLHVER